MIELIAFLSFFIPLSDAVMPQPTQEQIALVKQMGDDDFEEREKATEKLLKMDRQAILALERYGLTSPDMEIVHRSRKTLEMIEVVRSSKGSTPACYGLFRFKKIKLPSGGEFSVAQGTALSYFNAGGGNVYDWQTQEIGAVAGTELFVKNLIRSGYNRKDVIAILDAVEENANRYNVYNLQYTEDNPMFGDYGGEGVND